MVFTTESAEMQVGTERAEERLNRISGQIIGAAIEVHRTLGPGLLESTYEACLDHELRARGLPIQRQWPLPVTYKGAEIDRQYRLDLVVGGRVVVEIKAVEQLLPIHQAQILSYLRISDLPLGLLSTSIASPSRKASAVSGTFDPTLRPPIPLCPLWFNP